MKVVRLSFLHTGRLYPTGNIPGTYFFWKLSQPQGHSAAGRMMSMKSATDTIGNQIAQCLNQLPHSVPPLPSQQKPNVNPLNAELNSICHMLALLGAHHILHISRLRVNHTFYLWSYTPILVCEFFMHCKSMALL